MDHLAIIPVLGVSIGASALAGALGWAFAKAVLAFAVVFFTGRMGKQQFRIITGIRRVSCRNDSG